MQTTRRWALAVALFVAFAAVPQVAHAKAKEYQVTGPIIELTDSQIVVQKGKDRWEIDRNADTKVDGELKVGEKVTVHYTMTATKIEAKSDSKSDKK